MDAPRIRRRALLSGAAASTGLAGCTDDSGPDGDDATGDGGAGDSGVGDGGDDGPADELPDTLALEPFATEVSAPVDLVHAPSEERFYVVEQSGQVVALDEDGSRDGTALDLGDAVTAGGEMGLLGLALDPAFPERRTAYVRYSAPAREGTPDDWSHTSVCSAFPVETDGSFDAAGERTVIEIPQPQGNHNAGDLAFGPDGHLYVPTGDGGAAGDQGTGHPDDWYDGVGGGNGQDTSEQLLGGMLRLDVHAEPTEHPRTDADAPDAPAGEDGYAIPDDNPLVDATDHRDEYYAWGLRNPWRISFDRPASGDSSERRSDGGERLYVADVGQDSWEEVNVVERGGNYGWNVREGTHCFGGEDCPGEAPADVRGGASTGSGEPLRDPIVEYPTRGDARISGIAVIGGHVYRGDAVPDLAGTYVFGDLDPRGRLFAAVEPDDGGLWPVAAIDLQGALVQSLFSIGRDADGECYLLGEGSDGGGIWRIGTFEN